VPSLQHCISGQGLSDSGKRRIAHSKQSSWCNFTSTCREGSLIGISHHSLILLVPRYDLYEFKKQRMHVSQNDYSK
jgi:hypothetical protein